MRETQCPADARPHNVRRAKLFADFIKCGADMASLETMIRRRREMSTTNDAKGKYLSEETMKEKKFTEARISAIKSWCQANSEIVEDVYEPALKYYLVGS
jgi:hypothetical protein